MWDLLGFNNIFYELNRSKLVFYMSMQSNIKYISCSQFTISRFSLMYVMTYPPVKGNLNLQFFVLFV